MATLSFSRPVIPTDALRAFMDNANEVALDIFRPETAYLSFVEQDPDMGHNQRATKPVPAHKMYDVGSLAVSVAECVVSGSERRSLARLWEKLSRKEQSSSWKPQRTLDGFNQDIDASGRLEYPVASLDQRFSPSARREYEVVFRTQSGGAVQSQLLRDQSAVYDTICIHAERFRYSITQGQCGVVPFMRLPFNVADADRLAFFLRFDSMQLPRLILGDLSMKFES